MVRPLDKITGAGEVLIRPPEIEQAISDALSLSIEAAQAQAEEMRMEVLLHLFCHAQRMYDEKAKAYLFPVLHSRCLKILERRIIDSLPGSDEIRLEDLARKSHR